MTSYYRQSEVLEKVRKIKPVTLELPPAHPKQFELINSFESHEGLRFIVGACGSKFGKAVQLDTPIPTPTGWKTMGDIAVGDYVFDEKGYPVRVDYVTDPMVGHKCYEVEFSDGSTVKVDAEHWWITRTKLARRSHDRGAKYQRNPDNVPKKVTTQEIKDTLLYHNSPNHSVDVCGVLEYPEQALSLDPYVLGVWLGDGTSCSGNNITSEDPEILDHLTDAGFSNYVSSYNHQRWNIQGLTTELRSLNVIDNKHVPIQYLHGSKEQRLALLQGLMDTDGTISLKGHCCFDNTNVQLADSVQELCHSFGIQTRRYLKKPTLNGRRVGVNGDIYKDCHRIHFTTYLPVFRLKRKLARIRPVSNRMKRRMIVAVRDVESKPVKCIRVESPRHLFLVGKACIPTHNTMGCCIRLVQEAWANKDTLNWWIAPSYAQSTNAYNLVKKLLPKDSFKEYKATLKLEIIEPDGSLRSTIEFKSGDNPDTLRGFGVHFFVIDEAARIPYESFVSVMTTVTQTRGRGIIISTPNARNWFYDVYQRGEKCYDDGTSKFTNGDVDKYPEWLSIRMPTWSNPHVQVEAILELKNNLPEDAFRQEVAAQFLMDSAGVFKGVSKCIKGNLEAPLPGHSYVMGVDLARLQDYTVICVIDRHRGHVVYFDRLNQTSWEVIYNRVIQTARTYHATVVSDWTGIGDPILETLKGAGGLHFEPYKIGSSTAKQQLIDKLRVNIEQQKISFPASLNVLRKELESYEYSMTEAGRVQFSAPTGFHDDCVIALALANWGADKEQFVYKFSNVRL